MNAIDKYLKLKREFEYFNGWRSLIGAKYFGGTRGKGGEYGKVVSATGSLTIYHQASDGAKNYHEMHDTVRPEFQEVLKEMSAELLRRTEVKLRAKLEAARKEAEALSMELSKQAEVSA